MVVALAERPLRRDPSTIVDHIVVLGRLGRCESCRHIDQPLVEVTYRDGEAFEVCGGCMP